MYTAGDEERLFLGYVSNSCLRRLRTGVSGGYSVFELGWARSYFTILNTMIDISLLLRELQKAAFWRQLELVQYRSCGTSRIPPRSNSSSRDSS